MPMDSSANWQLITNEHLHVVPFVNFNHWTGLLSIDQVDFTRVPIYQQLGLAVLVTKVGNQSANLGCAGRYER